MRYFIILLSCIALLLSVSAHSGGTDSKGGHRNSVTGEYHYHHGHSAHQHTDLDGDGKLDCPFDFDDKTGQSSGSKSSSKSNSQTPKVYTNRFSQTPSTTKESNSVSVPLQNSEPSNKNQAVAITCICIAAFVGVCHYISNRK